MKNSLSFLCLILLITANLPAWAQIPLNTAPVPMGSTQYQPGDQSADAATNKLVVRGRAAAITPPPTGTNSGVTSPPSSILPPTVVKSLGTGTAQTQATQPSNPSTVSQATAVTPAVNTQTTTTTPATPQTPSTPAATLTTPNTAGASATATTTATAREYQVLAQEVETFKSGYVISQYNKQIAQEALDASKTKYQLQKAAVDQRLKEIEAMKDDWRDQKKKYRSMTRAEMKELASKDTELMKLQADLKSDKEELDSFQAAFDQAKARSDANDKGFNKVTGDFKKAELAAQAAVNSRAAVEKRKGFNSPTEEPLALKESLDGSVYDLHQKWRDEAFKAVQSRHDLTAKMNEPTPLLSMPGTPEAKADEICHQLGGTLAGSIRYCKVGDAYVSTLAMASVGTAKPASIIEKFMARKNVSDNCDDAATVTKICEAASGAIIPNSNPLGCGLKDGDHSYISAKTLCEGSTKNKALADALTPTAAQVAALNPPPTAEVCSQAMVELTQLVLKNGNSQILSEMVNVAAVKMAYRMATDPATQAASGQKTFEKYTKKNLSNVQAKDFQDKVKQFYQTYGEHDDRVAGAKIFSAKSFDYNSIDMRLDNASSSALLLYMSQSSDQTGAYNITEEDAAAVWAQAQITDIKGTRKKDGKLSAAIGDQDVNLSNFPTQIYHLLNADAHLKDTSSFMDPKSAKDSLPSRIENQTKQIEDQITAAAKLMTDQQKLACFKDDSGNSCSLNQVKLGSESLKAIQRSIASAVSKSTNSSLSPANPVQIDWANSQVNNGAILLKLAQPAQ